MAITPRLEIRHSQNLLMTTELRQAISLLQMSNIELADIITQELEKNPLLELEDDIINDIQIENTTIDSHPPKATETQTPLDIDYDNEFDDYGSDRQSYDTNSDYAFEDSSKLKSAKANEDFNFFEEKVKDEKSLYQLINEQVQIHFSKNKDKIIAFCIIKDLDDAGYFRGNCEQIAKQLNISENQIQKILQTLKTFEPSGIFAQSLSECIAIQLSDQNLLDEKTKIVLNNLELLGRGKLTELKKICLINSDEEILAIIKNIKAQNPKPASDFLQERTTYIIPDVIVRTNKYNEYIVELNSQSLPKVLINQQYITKFKNNNKQENKYIKTQISSANFLIKAMHQRATTILRVSEEIIKSQYDFFQKGINHLKPMLLKDIAQAIAMHESTISRVTSNKYMTTPRGLFELKYFFSSKAGSYCGDEQTSTISIKHKIKILIDNEDKTQILSDDKIVEELAKKSIKIARRTVAKYRESMKIPTSSLRKKTKNSKI